MINLKPTSFSTFALIAALTISNPSQAQTEDCLNLEKIGLTASALEDLETRIDITDILGLDNAVEENRITEKQLVNFLSDHFEGEVNNYFFSFKHGRTENSFPKQSGCGTGSTVGIPEASHYAKYTILEATSDRLILLPKSFSDGLLILTKGSEGRIDALGSFNVLGSERTESGEIKSWNVPAGAKAVITWGKKGTLTPAPKSQHFKDLLTQHGIGN